MKKFTLLALAAMTLLAGGLFLAGATAGDEKAAKAGEDGEVAVDLMKVPQAVMATVSKEVPGAKPVSAIIETEDGETFYEVKLETADGRTFEVKLKPDGALVEKEEEPAKEDGKEEGEEGEDGQESVEIGKLPEPVLATLATAVPGAKPVEASLEEDEGEEVYEVKAEAVGGRKIEVSILADGSLIETEESVTEDALPAAVRETLSEILPTGKTAELEKKSVVIYEVKREVGEKTYELMIDATGKVMKIKCERGEDEGDKGKEGKHEKDEASEKD